MISGSPATPVSAPQAMSSTTSVSRSTFKNTEPNSLPNPELTATMTLQSPQLSVESEVDLESENELPTMTPPPTKQLPLRLRNALPFDNEGMNNLSPSNTVATMPPMQRAHSSPGTESVSRIVTPTHSYPRRPPSPLSSGRRRSPLRSTYDETLPGPSWSSLSIEPNIPEHAELELTSPLIPENEFGGNSAIPTYSTISNTFPRSRRRPNSPLHQSASAPSLHQSARAASLHSSGGNSPSFSAISAAKFANEPYPAYGYSLSSASSMPSTPTSMRSRSPSISSLETIEDTPDAEEAARLEEESTKQRSGDEMDSGEPRRKGLELRTASLRSNKDRKRWSVCGAERRADFSLEPIEE